MGSISIFLRILFGFIICLQRVVSAWKNVYRFFFLAQNIIFCHWYVHNFLIIMLKCLKTYFWHFTMGSLLRQYISLFWFSNCRYIGNILRCSINFRYSKLPLRSYVYRSFNIKSLLKSFLLLRCKMIVIVAQFIKLPWNLRVSL